MSLILLFNPFNPEPTLSTWCELFFRKKLCLNHVASSTSIAQCLLPHRFSSFIDDVSRYILSPRSFCYALILFGNILLPDVFQRTNQTLCYYSCRYSTHNTWLYMSLAAVQHVLLLDIKFSWKCFLRKWQCGLLPDSNFWLEFRSMLQAKLRHQTSGLYQTQLAKSVDE